jgi:oxygen-independent coproporphyrinogen III oxidase
MPLFTTTVPQVTNNGRPLQAKKRDFVTIDETLRAVNSSPSEGLRIRGAYLHVPFCFHKCHYCDFYSIVDSRDRQGIFTDRLIRELEAASEFIQASVETVFVGGGTPTLLKVEHWQRLLPVMRDRLRITPEVEFTVEANPETVTEELVGVLKAGGVNRVSIGCQSFNPQHLKSLERWHDPQNVHRSVSILRNAGIDNFNLDLIFAIPGQTVDQWLADLNEAIALRPSHISCYGLTYEANTPMTVKMKSGAIEPAEQELEAEMYLATIHRLAEAGYDHYEISNWSRRTPENSDANRCQHNLFYWKNANWWAFGPSASGHVKGLRWKNIGRLGEYLESDALPPITDVEQLDEDGRTGEQLMLGLRLIQGIDGMTLNDLLNRGSQGEPRRDALRRAVECQLIETRTDGGMRFTTAGLLQADSVIAELL